MFKVIWVAGMPRSGSMWTFNVVRELVKRAGFRVLPAEVPMSDQDTATYANREFAVNRDPNAIFVLKMHSYLQQVPPNQFVITNLRDARDALVSYMRFMHADFERALAAGKAAAGVADYYLNLPEEKRMVLRYEEMTSSPALTIARIADRIGLSIDDGAVEEIATQFSKENVRALIENKDRCYRESVENKRPVASQVLLSRGDGVITTRPVFNQNTSPTIGMAPGMNFCLMSRSSP